MNRLVDACNVTVSHPLAFGTSCRSTRRGTSVIASIAGGSDENSDVRRHAQKLRHNVQLTSTCRLDAFVLSKPMSIVTL